MEIQSFELRIPLCKSLRGSGLFRLGANNNWQGKAHILQGFGWAHATSFFPVDCFLLFISGPSLAQQKKHSTTNSKSRKASKNQNCWQSPVPIVLTADNFSTAYSMVDYCILPAIKKNLLFTWEKFFFFSFLFKGWVNEIILVFGNPSDRNTPKGFHIGPVWLLLSNSTTQGGPVDANPTFLGFDLIGSWRSDYALMAIYRISPLLLQFLSFDGRHFLVYIGIQQWANKQMGSYFIVKLQRLLIIEGVPAPT